MEILNIKYVHKPEKIEGINVVNNADEAVNHLKNGETVARFEYGDSMQPILKDGEYCILTPLKSLDEIKVGDAVFCKVNGFLMTHMVLAISNSNFEKPYFLISSTDLNVFGWTSDVYAIAKGTNICEKPLKYDSFLEIND